MHPTAYDLLSVRTEEIGTLFGIITRPSKQHTKALPDVEYRSGEADVCGLIDPAIFEAQWRSQIAATVPATVPVFL